MKNILFVLGAEDPEMLKIEEILNLMEYRYILSENNNKRSCAYDAYRSEVANIEDFDIVCIEAHTTTPERIILNIDHHHPRDYGFFLGADKFLEASSVGQLLSFIFTRDLDSALEKLNFQYVDRECNIDGFVFMDDKWFFSINNKCISIPKDIMMLAATDHCLKDAYQGGCPGISKEEVFEYRVESLSLHNNIDISKVKELILEFLDKVVLCLEFSIADILDLRHIDLGEGLYPLNYLIMREVSLKHNIPIALSLKKGERDKIMFLGLQEKQIEELLKESSFMELKLIEMFGVPKRGYAGGFAS